MGDVTATRSLTRTEPVDRAQAAFVARRGSWLLAAALTFLISYAVLSPTAFADDFNVRSYGAVGDGQTNDGPAIQRAIDAAIHVSRSSKVIIPAGRYLLGPAFGHGVAQLVIAGAHDLSISGTSETWLVSAAPRLSIFAIANSSNIRLDSLILDRSPVLFAQGVIRQVDAGQKTVIMTVDGTTGSLESAVLSQNKGLLVFSDPASGSWGSHSAACAFYKPTDPSVCWPPTITERRQLGTGTWELTLNTPPEAGDLGKRAVVWSGVYKGRAFLILHSSDVTISDLTYLAEGDEGGFIVDHSRGTIKFDHFTMGVQPGSGRLIGSTGGAMVFNNHAHLVLDHVDISQSWDDCLNMGANFARIYAQLSPTVLEVDGSRADFIVGDHLSVWDWRRKMVTGRVAITTMACDKKPDIVCQLTLDHVVKIDHPGFAPVRSEGNDTDGIDRVIDLDGVGTLTITNSRFQSLHARCLLIKASHSLVDNSVCHDTVMAGIIIGPNFFWDEGPETQGIIVQNNVFRNVSGPNIIVGNGGSPVAPSVTGVTIINNQFVDYGRFRHGVDIGSGVPIMLQKAMNPTIARNQTSTHFAVSDASVSKVIDDKVQIR